ncbi:MAG TPA: nucleotide disphospho-sugar-binding domain-containing protein [Allosphingosinicella sp.]|nr:nucleotide disphospho-sugar-binding domain-containing protein [Allosphingosinicella sp.]
MAHFAFVAPPLAGHYRPLSNLAIELIARRHRVTFLHHEDARPLVEAEGAGFEALGRGEAPVARWTDPMARIRGLIGLGGTLDGMIRFTDMFCSEAPAALERIGADAMIVDQLEAGGGLVAEHLSLPFASVAVTVPINREPGVPPPYVGWGHDPSEKGVRRNLGGWRVSDWLMHRVGKGIERNAQRLGLPPRRRLEDCLSTRLQISQMVRSLDFPRSRLPAEFHYTGPFRNAGPKAFELPPGDGRPLVYCTLGTLQGSRAGLFRKVARACADLDVRLLISQGNRGRLRSENLPGNPLVYDWVPQEAVLARADMVVSHGGMNSVLEPLAQGLPMVVMPLAFEQSATAARLEHAGVARALSPRASSRRLAHAIAEVRRDPGIRERAEAVRLEMRAAGGVRRAADLIEAALT